MVACEPGQDGNGAAISTAIMCLGAPPRLTRNLSYAVDFHGTFRAGQIFRVDVPTGQSKVQGEAVVSDPAPERTGTGAGSASYQVVARRYRPQTLDEIVGQDHVVSALRNAIRLNRVTHAYLFTGTRGVGKTSIARIFAKCLNCEKGPTDKPCNECDICKAISVGQDVDVIEIDGASNNGVEAVRELRANVSLRPSRSRYKIYYIDEVHMLSTGAFNALLKTLEEPPEHVKFFFATTESHKIPITILSRCQRFDFAGISPEQIVETLAEICRKEGVDVEIDALWTVARRAGGSMRDAQSHLERLLVHSEGKLTDDRAREILGMASDDRMIGILESIVAHDLAAVLVQIETAMGVGVQPGDLIGGLLELLRDAMVHAAGSTSPLISVGSRQKARLETLVQDWSIESILAGMQILAETRRNMKGSPHGRLLLELGLARVTRLDHLSELGDIIARIKTGGGPAPARRNAQQISAQSLAPAVATQRIAPAATPTYSSQTTSTPQNGSAASFAPTSRSAPAEATASAPTFRSDPIVRQSGPSSSTPHRDDPPPTGSMPGSAGEQLNGTSESPQPAVRADLPDLETVQHRWLEFVGKLGMRYGMIIASYPPTRIEPTGVIHCRVPMAYESMVENLCSEEDQQKIERLTREVWDCPLRLKIEVTEQATSAVRNLSEKDARWDAIEEEPILKTFVELFQPRRFWMDQD